MVFRLDYVEGDPRGDGDETMDAGFFTPEEIAGMDTIQALSRWSIHRAWAAAEQSAFELERDLSILPDRPGWQAFAAQRAFRLD